MSVPALPACRGLRCRTTDLNPADAMDETRHLERIKDLTSNLVGAIEVAAEEAQGDVQRLQVLSQQARATSEEVAEVALTVGNPWFAQVRKAFRLANDEAGVPHLKPLRMPR